MIKEGEEKQFELSKGSNLINNKYKVLSRIGTGEYSSVHAISVIKGQKQVIRAIKVVPTYQCRKGKK